MEKRRSFIKKTAILTTTILTSKVMATEIKANKQILHHVFFWLKNPESIADRDKLVEGVKTLKAIPTIKNLRVGVVASTEKRDVVDISWGVSELMYFDDTAGQKVYQDHPIHQDFIKNYGHLWAKVIVYDALDV
jgi:Stress responsive A/B Barrel Domain